jgi:hypothetical protein
VEVNVRGGEGGIREVEKEYEGIFIHAFDERGSWEYWDRVKVYSGIYSAPGLKRFWARRARTSIDVLGLGVLVGRVAGFGVS